ncbi:MAG: AarF/UbiB family protein [bacterium]
MSAPDPKDESVEKPTQGGFIPVLVEKTRYAIKSTHAFTVGLADIYQAASPVTELLNRREMVTKAELHRIFDDVFEAFGRHPVMGQLRDLTSEMRERNILPNEQTTEDLIKTVISRVSNTNASGNLIPVEVTEEFWRFFNELASEPELNGLGEISLDVMRIIVETYEPLMVKIINQLKELRHSSDDQARQVLNSVLVIREDLVIFKRQIKALRHIKPFFQTDPTDYKAQAEIVARMVREFGPFFIKIAQVAAANSDFLPEEMAEALAVFQEDVEPMTPDEVERAFLECYGVSPQRRYFDFDASKPLKSGSIASVYVAHRPLNPDGDDKMLTPLVIKVGRHNLEREFLIGKTVIKLAILTSQYWAPHSKLAPFLRSWLDQTDVFVEGFNQELDFDSEASSQARFEVRSQHSAGWHVPRVFSSTRRIIEMELVENAVSLNKAFEGMSSRSSRKARRKVARAYLHAILTHMLVYREFHGDLHQGNILVRNQQELYFIDWGNTVDLTHVWQDALGYLKAVFTGDARGVTRAVLSMCADPDAAREQEEEIVLAVEKVFNEAHVKPLGLTFAVTLRKEGIEGLKQRLELAVNLVSALARKGITIQGDYIHLSRSVTAMIGSFGSLYRGLKPMEICRDLLQVLVAFPSITSWSLVRGIQTISPLSPRSAHSPLKSEQKAA